VADVAVVGAGLNGLATAWALRRDGVDVVAYEQFELGHARGSSHGRTRIFRLAYPEEKWVRFAQDALDGWRELERQSGEELLLLNGLLELYLGVTGSGQGVAHFAHLGGMAAGYALLVFWRRRAGPRQEG